MNEYTPHSETDCEQFKERNIRMQRHTNKLVDSGDIVRSNPKFTNPNGQPNAGEHLHRNVSRRVHDAHHG